VQLEQIETIHGQTTKAAFHGATEVCGGEVLGWRASHGAREMVTPEPEQPDQRPDDWLEPGHDPSLRRKDVPGLARDDDLLASRPEGAPQEPLALSLAVHVRGIEKVDARVQRRGEKVEELGRIALEDAADAGSTETELGDMQIGAAKAPAANVHNVIIHRLGSG
jgi:hypothetical protein